MMPFEFPSLSRVQAAQSGQREASSFRGRSSPLAQGAR